MYRTATNIVDAHPAGRSRALDRLTFLIGLLSFWYVNVVGELYIIEIAAPLLLLILWPAKNRLIFEMPARRILFLGMIWLCSQIATDLYRGTPWTDVIRGWAAIIVFLILFMVVIQLISADLRRMYLLLFGIALGGILRQFVQPSPFFEGEPWKFGFGQPLALLMITWIGWRCKDTGRVPIQWVVAMVAFGALSIYLNARSLGGFMVIVAFFIWFRSHKLGRSLAGRKLTFSRLILLGFAGVLAVIAVLKSYEFAVTGGWLGDEALKKYQVQSSGTLGLIIGGRAEVIPAVFAVMDSPILGHGSWAKDPKYRDYLWLLLDMGYGTSENHMKYYINRTDRIPAHSHILQAWVWAGLLGAVFWFSILMLVVRALIASFRFPHALFVPTLFYGLHACWDVFFSPFGSMMRFTWAATIVLLLLAIRLANDNFNGRGDVGRAVV